MSNLSKRAYLKPITLVKDNIFYEYYDYVGRVKVDRKLDGSIRDVSIKHSENDVETLCHIDKRYFEKLAKYEGKIISFRGRLNLSTNAAVTPHIS